MYCALQQTNTHLARTGKDNARVLWLRPVPKPGARAWQYFPRISGRGTYWLCFHNAHRDEPLMPAPVAVVGRQGAVKRLGIEQPLLL